jgi:hypothetical protein
MELPNDAVNFYDYTASVIDMWKLMNIGEIVVTRVHQVTRK